MGIGGISVGSLLLILVIVLLVFGTKKIRNLGGDLGGAIRDFRKGVSEDPDADKSAASEDKSDDAAPEDKPAAEKAKDA